MDTTTGDAVDTKEARLAHPSGLLYLFRHDAVPILLDAILDLPPNREFNKSQFADHAGVTRQTVGNYIELLVEVNVVERVPETRPERYRVTTSPVVQELYELNSAINDAHEDCDADSDNRDADGKST